VKVLALETATAVCAAALVADGEVIAEETVTRRFVHAEKLMMMIGEALQRSGCERRDLNAIAVSIGPGSFTGLRIGLATGKGLTYALGIPLIAVPTLEALSVHLLRSGGTAEGGFILPVLDARRDEVYTQLFHAGPDGVSAVWEARDVRVSDIAGMTRDHRPILVGGDGAQKFHQTLSTSSEREVDRFRFIEDHLSQCSAGTVGLIGERMLKNGDTADPATAEPKYVKEFYTTAG
jgi:tRNA threonylcarbamoyladenosine biosynthesis protein TsaB